MSDTPSSPSSLSSDGDKENASQSTKSDYKRNRFNNRFKNKTTKKLVSENFIKKGDPKSKGYCCQCYGELGRETNQCTRTTNKIKSELSKEHYSSHLIEPTFRGEEIDYKEPDDPSDDAPRVELMRWELGMKDHYENDKLTKEVFSVHGPTS